MSEAGQKNQAIIAGVVGLVVGVLATFGITQFSKVDSDDPVIAKWNGNSVRASEAFAPVKTRVFELEEELYRLKQRAANDFIEQKLLEDVAKKENSTVEQLIDKKFGSDDTKISDAQIEVFLKSKGLKLDDPRIRKKDVEEYLKFRARFDKRQQYVSTLKQGANITYNLKAPTSPKLTVTTDGYPSWGSKNAKVTIVEFSDYECPFCSRAIPTINRIKKEYGEDKVRIIFRDMPLPNHPRAQPASLAAHCANDQGKFWEFHDMLFENQQKLQDKDFKEYAKKLSLDEKKFDECYSSNKHGKIIEASKREAQALGIQATPSFVINGTLLQGAQPFERFKEKIDAELK